MKKLLIAFILILTLGLALGSAALAIEYYFIGDIVSDFSVTTPDGQEYTLSGLLETHKAVLINFWYADCMWCVEEFPYIEEFYQKMGDEVAVLALSPYDSDERIALFQAQHNLTFPMAQDDIALTNSFDIHSYPVTILIDRFGVYCLRQTGALPSAEAFYSMSSLFISDDYTEPLMNPQTPAVLPTVEMPAVEEIAAAITADGSVLTYSAGRDYSWPWVIGSDETRSWVVTSNAGQDSSLSEIVATVDVQAGDALVFDYRISCEPIYDQFTLLVDGKSFKTFSGNFDWRTYAVPFAESGTHEIRFRYIKDSSYSSFEDTVMLSNLRLLSGAEAEAALAANPAIPNPLPSGNGTIEPVNEGARAIMFRDAEGNPLTTFNSFALDGIYLIEDSDTARLRVRIAERYDPEAALFRSSYEDAPNVIGHLEQGTDGYYATTSLNGVVTLTYLNLDYMSIDSLVMLFRDTAGIDTFCALGFSDATGAPLEGVTWEFVDGEAAAAPSDVEHVLLFTDADGNALAGVTANVCDDSTCTVVVSDESGRASFTGAPYAYDVHVLRAPEGYAVDPDASFLTNVQGGETVIVIEKSE